MTQYINLNLSSGPLVVSLPLGDDAPRFTGGTARWDTIERPRRKSLTNFAGEDPWTCTIKVLFDAWPLGDVEPYIRLVEDRMHRPDDRVEPDLLRLNGAAMSSHSDLVWVLTGVDDSGQVQKRDDGRRCRQEMTLTFLEYVSPVIAVVAKSPAAAAAARAGEATSSSVAAAPAATTYTVKAGDTLSTIAASKLGSASKWQQLADLNGIRDPRSLKVGQVLKLS